MVLECPENGRSVAPLKWNLLNRLRIYKRNTGQSHAKISNKDNEAVLYYHFSLNYVLLFRYSVEIYIKPDLKSLTTKAGVASIRRFRLIIGIPS